MSLLSSPYHLQQQQQQQHSKPKKKKTMSSDRWVDETTAPAIHQYLTTIEEVNEDDEFEDVDMDEKGLLSNEYRTPARSHCRRRLFLQLTLCLAIGIFIIHTVLTHNTDSVPDDLVHLHNKASSSASTTSKIAADPSILTATTPSSPPPPTSSSTPTTPTTSTLQSALSHLPDGKTYATLLSPAPSSPSEHYAHLALRIKTYASLFPSYLSLHPSTGPTPLHPRFTPSDLVPPHTTAAQRRSPEILGETIRQYETLRYLFNALSDKLWPFLRVPTGEGVVALRREMEGWGRGVVMTVRKGEAGRRAGMIRRLRGEGCALPVEVVVLDEEALGNEAREELVGLDGVVVRSLGELVGNASWVREETLKPLALLGSRFREAVFLNTDVLPDKPGALFEDEGYEKKGARFLRAQGPRKYDGGKRVDHNVVVVDKARHFVALLASVRLSGSEWVRDEGLLEELGVKKEFVQSEMWRLAFEMVGEEKLDFFTK
ncbi:mannosyltransferase-like protein 4 [Elsinoe australis]|uniref:Mannosyltransferase-like protein 4 n=1 Tax=Elsinoe australis TaxID=40998 RepID=A0A4U7AMP3_9PEZI|nr:mannosyltransferase-like protein 4 [Elsinoe australis]